jgi:hypothetical protein
MDRRSHDARDDAPRIESRTPITDPLIGTLSSANVDTST